MYFSFVYSPIAHHKTIEFDNIGANELDLPKYNEYIVKWIFHRGRTVQNNQTTWRDTIWCGLKYVVERDNPMYMFSKEL